MFSQHGTMGVSQLARDAGLGVRQFERNFMQAIGVTPKRFARVARFQSALDAKLAWPDRSWLHIAHDLEYFDQMHMIRDFQSLGGETPTQLLSQLGDARPPALLAETKYK
jgi:transcriptional regulator GlxA family with amidase domain